MKNSIRKIIATAFVAATLTACGTPRVASQYETTSPDDAAALAGGERGETRLQQIAQEQPERILAGYPAACTHKDCAGPQMQYHGELRDAALLLSAMTLLYEATVDTTNIVEREGLIEIVRARLPQLRSRVSVTRMDLLDSGFSPADFDAFAVALEQLDRADQIAGRLDRVLAQHDAPKPNSDVMFVTFK